MDVEGLTVSKAAGQNAWKILVIDAGLGNRQLLSIPQQQGGFQSLLS